MQFEISGVEVAVWVPPLVAFAMSAVTSTGGVSGAFLLLPFQMSVLGYTAPSVSATNQLYNVVAIPSGVYAYTREGRLLWPLAALLVVGSLPGVLAGALLRVRYLPDPRSFQLFVAAVLLLLGLRLLTGLRKSPPAPPTVGAPAHARLSASSLTYELDEVTVRASTPAILALSLVVGVVGGAYGIGGGAIVAPFLVSVLGMPVHTVAGAALLATLVSSVAGVASYVALAPLVPDTSVAPDWLLGLLFGVGGTAGTFVGARLQKHVPARWIEGMLAAVVLLVAARYASTT